MPFSIESDHFFDHKYGANTILFVKSNKIYGNVLPDSIIL